MAIRIKNRNVVLDSPLSGSFTYSGHKEFLVSKGRAANLSRPPVNPSRSKRGFANGSLGNRHQTVRLRAITVFGIVLLFLSVAVVIIL